jgi:hypothetical protein
MHGGISCILRIDQKLILVTAGHLFPKDAAKGAVISVFDGSRYEPVATLMRNFLEDTEPLDAAVCALTDEGLRYLRQSTGAVTFRCAGVALPEKWTPSSSWQPIFFPTQPDGARPLTVRLESASSGVLAQESCAFDDDVEWRVTLRGLIRTNGLTDSADSGSVLIVKSGEQFGLLGLCSGGVPGRFSLFTPIATVIRRLKAACPQKEINLWTGSGK